MVFSCMLLYVQICSNAALHLRAWVLSVSVLSCAIPIEKEVGNRSRLSNHSHHMPSPIFYISSLSSHTSWSKEKQNIPVKGLQTRPLNLDIITSSSKEKHPTGPSLIPLGPPPALVFASTEASDFSSSSTTSTRPLPAAQSSGVQPRIQRGWKIHENPL